MRSLRPPVLRVLFLGALALAGDAPATRAQVVKTHVALLPAAAGLNPLGLGALLADPATSSLYLLHATGLTAFNPQAPATLLNFRFDVTGMSAPAFHVLDAASGRLLVSDAGIQQLVAYDTVSRTVVARVAMPFVPGRLVLDATAGRLYVLEQAAPPPSLQVAAVHAGSLGVLATTTLPTAVSSAAVNETTGKLYVTSNAGGVTYALAPDLTLAATIATGAMSADVDVNPAAATRGKVYVVRNDGNVAVIDAATDSVLTTLPVTGAQRVLANRSNGSAYVTGNDGNLTVIDPAQTASTVTLGGNPAVTAATAMVMDPARTRLFVADVQKLTQGRVTVFDITGATPVRRGAGFTGGTGNTQMAYSAARQRLYVTDALETAVSEFDPATFTATPSALGASMLGLALAEPTNKCFVAEESTREAVVVDFLAPTAPPVRTPVGALPILGGNDGSVVHVVSQNAKTITRLSAATGSPAGAAVTGLPNDATIALAFDRTVTAGPKGFLLNPNLSQTPPNAQYVEVYHSALNPPTLNGIGGNCIFTPCIIGTAEGVNQTTHQLHVLGVQVMLPMTIVPAIMTYNTNTEREITVTPLPTPFDNPPFFAEVDEANDQVYVPAINNPPNAARVVAVHTSTRPPTFTDLLTAGTPNGFALRGGRLYVSESTGVVEVWNTASNALVSTIPTGGAPTALAAPASTNRLWVLNEGLPAPGVQVYDTSTLNARLLGTLTDIAYLAPSFLGGSPFAAMSSGPASLVDNLHGTVAVLDPASGPADVQVAPDALPDGIPGVAYPATPLTQSGGAGPFTWSLASGALPPGLVLNPATGVITGTPTTAGIWSFQVRLLDQNGGGAPREDVQEFQIQVLGLRVVTSSLPDAGCSAYSVQLLAAGGTAPYTWSIANPPAWLDPLAIPTGLLRGTPPMTPSTCPPLLDVTVTDARNRTATTSLCLMVTSGSVPGPVGNELRAVKSSADVVLSRSSTAPPAGGVGFNVHRSADQGATWPRRPAGGPLPPSTPTGDYTDAGAVTNAEPLDWYQLRIVSACGAEGP